VRFTREVSKSNALGIVQRGDTSLVRASEDGALDADPYSDNVVDLCPVGALALPLVPVPVARLVPATHAVRLSRLRRGCTVDIWHRKAEWKLTALDPARTCSIERVTPREKPEVNGPWICNKGATSRRSSSGRARCSDGQGQADRSRAAIACARGADRAREAAGRARVELGLERGARRIEARCCRTRFDASSSRTGCRSRRARSTTIC
jgi:NADH-quinone oxidoreductase subunit G